MADNNTARTFDTFDGIYKHLTSTFGYPVLPPKSPYPHDASLSHAIAELSTHPTLEAILHILNADLSSAHFLCRHMQNVPAWEGMYIHGILHRVEGDLDNAKAWYADVTESDCFRQTWSGRQDRACEFLNQIKELRDLVADQSFHKMLEDQSQREFDELVRWCKRRFGQNSVVDATQVWVEPSEEHRAIAAKMVVGGEGWRHF
jgi:hypothetical protein